MDFAPRIAALRAAARGAGITAVLDPEGMLDRTGHLVLHPPGRASPNRACRLYRTADGWLAVNLARDSDRALLPAWLGLPEGVETPRAIARRMKARSTADLMEGARLLGLPAAAVGEATGPATQVGRLGGPGGSFRNVLDLSALWAGPLCGALLVQAGLAVTKGETAGRPDVSRAATPDFYDRLNRDKRQIVFAPADLPRLVAETDILITSARPRAFAHWGLTPERAFAMRPHLIWVAISGHGWDDAHADRVGFGDDTAAAGGLVRWTPGGEPRFLGDALSDPLTGLAAAQACFESLARGGGELLDVAMARAAAEAACRATC